MMSAHKSLDPAAGAGVLAARRPCVACGCQRLADALRTARDEGAMDADRVADAANAAKEKGMLSDEECAQFQGYHGERKGGFAPCIRTLPQTVQIQEGPCVASEECKG